MGDFIVGDYVKVIDYLNGAFMAGMRGVIKRIDTDMSLTIEFEDEFAAGRSCGGVAAYGRGRFCFDPNEIELAFVPIRKSGVVDSIITSNLIKIKDWSGTTHVCKGLFGSLKIGDYISVKGVLVDNGVLRDCSFYKNK